MAATTANTLPTFPKLTRMQTCVGAVAAAAQRLERRAITVPRGFASSGVRNAVKNITVYAPAARSALWFQELAAGHRAARFVQHSTTITDAPGIVASETLELKEAAVRKAAPTDLGLDQSQPPRRLALWLLVHEDVAGYAVAGQQMLDAVAHWACSRTDAKASALATRLRISVATGVLKNELLRVACGREGADPNAMDMVETRLSGAKAAWGVLIRWSDEHGHVHSTIQSWRTTPVDANACVDQMQRAVCSLLAQYGLHICTATTMAVPMPVPHNAWGTQLEAVERDFAARLRTSPSVTLSPAAAAPEAAPLEFTGVFVRVCQRKLGDDGVTHASAFHGVLLSFGAAKEAAARFANSADPALACPLGLAEDSMGLHLCAVQAQEQPLLKDVSLFAHVGRAGMPIHPPFSHVLCESAAIRPVDQALLSTWDIRPCDKASITPGLAALQEPFKRHFSLASELYLSLADRSDGGRGMHAADTPRLRSGSSGEELDNMIERMPCAPVTNDPQAEHVDAMLRLAFHVDMRSRRTTIGDAYGYLFDSGAPKAVCDTMLSAMGQIGVRASLDDMFKLTANAVQASGQLTPDIVAENQRLKRLSEVCLEAMASDDRVSGARKRLHSLARPDPVALGAPEHVRRMITSLGLKRGKEAAVVPNMNDASVSAVVQAVRHSLAHYLPNSPLATDSQQTLMNAFQECSSDMLGDADTDRFETWTRITERAAARCAAIIVLRNGLRNTPVFIITSCVGTAAATVQQVAIEPLLSPSSFDAMVAAPRACVLLLQHTDVLNFKCKLTATVPAKQSTTTA